ncbi:putative NBD/HSP70 family sugar kinase [Tamaricihabitans halophyticus]|uniref:Putative NBD/HSP70 family sugar kinase n=1 Tax=Tamaricihabitans halophyticus TaxID=1262583 RepID=A0A4R2R1B4_9PSEU|nr:ROK family protein [Tamaricihabitans halophyticus]TCP56462.1 putative NBD/HSP70 family sugar kinase [Tamaricihabitans halophyticus]
MTDPAPQGLAEVLALFRQHASLTRAEVMALTGLARATVNQRLHTLLEHELLVPAGSSESTGGRKAERFAFHTTSGWLLVCDTGASGLRAALCDLDSRIALERTATVDIAAGPRTVLGQVAAEFDELLAAGGTRPVRGIAISVPGPVEFEAGRVIAPPIMTGWDGFDIRGEFATRYGCPTVVDNDVNVMALGEQRSAYPDIGHLLLVKAGTGIGSGIVSGGRILRGAYGAAGDIGHVPALLAGDSKPPACRCGNTGCVEAYAGGWALVRELRAHGHELSTVAEVAALLRAGEPPAVGLARRAGRLLGEAVATAVSILNPAAVIVAGQLADTNEQLLAGVRERVYQRSLPLATRRLTIERSSLGSRAGMTGLALQLADTVFAAPHIQTLLR